MRGEVLSPGLLAGSEGAAGSTKGTETGASPGLGQYRLDMPGVSRWKPHDRETNL